MNASAVCGSPDEAKNQEPQYLLSEDPIILPFKINICDLTLPSISEPCARKETV
jgi:hypothetical protein